MIGIRAFRSQTGRKRARTHRALRTTLALGIIFLTSIIMLSAIQHPLLRIHDLHITTDGALAPQEVETFAASKLHKKRFGIFPADSILFFSRASLATTLATQFPRIASTAIQRPSPRALHITINERRPEALWCGDVVPPIARERALPAGERSEELWGTCYFLDETGYLYAQAPLFTGNIYSRYYGSLTHGSPVGQQFLEREEFSSFQELYTSLVETAPLQALLIVDERDIELYTEDGLRIVTPRAGALPRLTERIATITTGATIDRARSVDYIDLRFAPKVYVKYAQGEKSDEVLAE